MNISIKTHVAILVAGLFMASAGQASSGAANIDRELGDLHEGVVIMATDLILASKHRAETLAKHMRKTSHRQCLAKDSNKICMKAVRELVWSTMEADNAAGYAGYQIEELNQMAQDTPFTAAQQELFTKLSAAYGILKGQPQVESTPAQKACVERVSLAAEARGSTMFQDNALAVEILICVDEAGVTKVSDFKKQAYEKQLTRVQTELQTSAKEMKDFELAFPDLHQQVVQKLKELGE